MARQKLIIIGAGGFAREVAWLAREVSDEGTGFDVKGYVVSDLAALGAHDEKAGVRGDFSWLIDHRDEFDALAIGIGNPHHRANLGRELAAEFPTKNWPVLVHPSVRADRASLKVDRGVLLCAGTSLTVNVHCKEFSMVNLNCTIGHEAILGVGSVLNPSVNISGGVSIGDEVLIGTGAQILQYLSIGDSATVGAGAVVVKDVEEGATVVGIPARPR